MEKYKSSYSSSMLLSTIIILVLIIYAIYTMVIQMTTHTIDSPSFVGASIALCVVSITLLYAFMAQIESVGLTENNIIIKKKYGKIVLSRTAILQARHKKSLITDIRVWGISGLFGHIGLFWNKNIGKYHAFVKNGNAMIEIKTTNKTYVISCDNYEQVLKALNKSHIQRNNTINAEISESSL